MHLMVIIFLSFILIMMLIQYKLPMEITFHPVVSRVNYVFILILMEITGVYKPSMGLL